MSLINSELNDLFDYGLKIYQNDNYFKFSIDSILLAEFVDVKKNCNNILDLCSGNLPVPLVLNLKYKNLNISAVELQKEIYELGCETLKYNNITNINYINDNVKNITNIFDNKCFDIITCNPPYFNTNNDEIINDNIVKAIARHEIEINLEEIIKVSSKVLKNMGYFYMVHKGERLADIIILLNKYNMGLKRVVPIYNSENSNCCFVLIEAINNGKNYVNIESPIFINKYTSYKNIFNKRK